MRIWRGVRGGLPSPEKLNLGFAEMQSPAVLRGLLALFSLFLVNILSRSLHNDITEITMNSTVTFLSESRTSVQQFEAGRVRTLETKQEQQKTGTYLNAASFPCDVCGRSCASRIGLPCTPSHSPTNLSLLWFEMRRVDGSVHHQDYNIRLSVLMNRPNNSSFASVFPISMQIWTNYVDPYFQKVGKYVPSRHPASELNFQ